MNGYQALVQERRRRLAESRLNVERIAVPRFDWVTATVGGVVDGVGAILHHGHAPEAEDDRRPGDVGA